MEPDLDALAQAVLVSRDRMRSSRLEHQRALEAYVAAGGTYSQLARLLGVSRQAVRQSFEREQSQTEE